MGSDLACHSISNAAKVFPPAIAAVYRLLEVEMGRLPDKEPPIRTRAPQLGQRRSRLEFGGLARRVPRAFRRRFLFLRFVCPALFMPHKVPLLLPTTRTPSKAQQRTLVLLVKLLQGLANNTTFSAQRGVRGAVQRVRRESTAAVVVLRQDHPARRAPLECRVWQPKLWF